MPFSFSHRTDWHLETNALTAKLNALRSQGRDIIDLTVSNPTRCDLDLPVEDVLSAFHHPDNLHYAPEPKGLLHAREEVAAYYRRRGMTVDPERIVLTASTSEAYGFIFRLLANPGDEVLMPAPGYPLFQYLAQLNDVEVALYPSVYQDGWRMDRDALTDCFSDRTRALVCVHPNNPTGAYIKPDERERMNALCRMHNAAIVCDEVFWDYSLGSGRPISFVENSEVLTFTLNGLSKILGMPQMKLGWIVVSGPDALVRTAIERLEVVADTFLSVSTPVQNALGAWMAHEAAWQERIQQRVTVNWQYLQDKADDLRLNVCRAEGGWYAVLRCEDGAEEDLVLGLLDKGVLAHPGYFFEITEGTHLVISLLTPPDRFAEGLTRIAGS